MDMMNKEYIQEMDVDWNIFTAKEMGISSSNTSIIVLVILLLGAGYYFYKKYKKKKKKELNYK